MARQTLVISNYWHRPGITVTVRHDEDAPSGAIHLEMALDDFLLALAAEAAHPLKIWTRASLARAIARVSHSTLEKVKESSTPGVMPAGVRA